MGIKDKVLDILFDDEGDDQNRDFRETHVNQNKKINNSSSITDTGSLFIDATSPLPKNKIKEQNEDTSNYDIKSSGENDYKMSENISPIFGVIDNKNKKNKNVSKVKSYNDLNNKNFESSKTQQSTYTSVVISPIFGPISTKSVKRNSKPRKKTSDPFYRDINDTGSFDAIIDEEEEQIAAPNFDEPSEEVIEPVSSEGDTDRLVKISDRINQIKNEAANIYDSDDSSNSDTISEDEYKVETFEHENISDVIHSVQNYDGKIDHTHIVSKDNQSDEQVTESEEETVNGDANQFINEPITEEFNNQTVETPVSFEDDITEDFESNEPSNSVETAQETSDSVSNEQVSVDDIFQDEDTEEEKDLFSVLFGDE